MTDQMKEILDIPQHLRRDNVGDDVQAMMNAVNVMESQSVLITKLQQELAESNDAMSQAQWRFEQAETKLDAVRKYATHSLVCDSLKTDTELPCNCGLDQALGENKESDT